ncbi:crossover junction endodeoxyribonuclease RuvC [Patescibacteria group bacterium]|nr:crossover junction endodeoxyribonuclease RuvC [Patescibacteria group bacterium]MBU4023472.1 crossover junction endodeoxyribonuclease RuvC [Patescibacteria group bacterium]MBU4078257.1 crossover junction endodeoxyribonuclease RuvC [Patescibacteria group bacterium]
MIILGVDPGTATTGWGVIKIENGGNLEYLDCGCIKTSKDLKAEDRLNQIYNELFKIIKDFSPKILVVEKLFFFKNAKTAIPVSQARGVILLAGAKKKIPIYEFTPLQVKLNIVGYGRAEKIQVQKMIKKILNLDEIPRPDDAADALGLAISYAYLLDSQKNTKNS